MYKQADVPNHQFVRLTFSLARMMICVLAPLLLNGCAALAVSLAGAGAGAGLSHQMNGTASRTFSERFDKVDTAIRIASKRMLLQVEEVASMDNGQVTRASVGGLEISLELETLSPNLTRVSVKARKDFFRVDSATAQEIVVQIERALISMNLAEANIATGSKTSDARYMRDNSAVDRKNNADAKRKGPI